MLAPAPAQPASYGDVTVRPIAQKPSLFPDHDSARTQSDEPATPPETFHPAGGRTRAAPHPPDAQVRRTADAGAAEIRQARGDSQARVDVEEDHPQKRLSLLQRLANVGHRPA